MCKKRGWYVDERLREGRAESLELYNFAHLLLDKNELKIRGGQPGGGGSSTWEGQGGQLFYLGT